MKHLLLLSLFLLICADFVAAQKGETSTKINYCGSEIFLKRLPTDNLQWSLMLAISKNDVECVRNIFAATKLNPNFRLVSGNTSPSDPPILAALAFEHVEIVKELIKAGLDIKSEDVNFALYAAAQDGKLEILKLLIEAGADVDGRTMSVTALMKASQGAHQDIVDFLLASKADVNAATDNGVTSLMAAGNNYGIVKTLLKAGAKIDAVDKEGRSALFYAVELTQIEKLKVLLENGANVGLKDKTGQTAFALTEKIEDTEKRSEIINLLKKHEAK